MRDPIHDELTALRARVEELDGDKMDARMEVARLRMWLDTIAKLKSPHSGKRDTCPICIARTVLGHYDEALAP